MCIHSALADLINFLLFVLYCAAKLLFILSKLWESNVYNKINRIKYNLRRDVWYSKSYEYYNVSHRITRQKKVNAKESLQKASEKETDDEKSITHRSILELKHPTSRGILLSNTRYYCERTKRAFQKHYIFFRRYFFSSFEVPFCTIVHPFIYATWQNIFVPSLTAEIHLQSYGLH